MGVVPGTVINDTAVAVDDQHRIWVSPKCLMHRAVKAIQQRLLLDDVYLIGHTNEDPADLARSANISASSEQAASLIAAFGDCRAEGAPAEQINRLHQFCADVFPHRYENAVARLADIDQLAATATQYPTRSRLLTELTLDPPGKTGDLAGPPHKDDDWLTLSTIHSAKGCEWRSVHLLHAADGNIPSDMAIGDKDGLAEELRLLYVALTRAKDELAVHVPLRYHVNRHGHDDRHLYAQMSRFIEPVRDLFDERGLPATNDTIDLTAGESVVDDVDSMLTALWE